MNRFYVLFANHCVCLKVSCAAGQCVSVRGREHCRIRQSKLTVILSSCANTTVCHCLLSTRESLLTCPVNIISGALIKTPISPVSHITHIDPPAYTNRLAADELSIQPTAFNYVDTNERVTLHSISPHVNSPGFCTGPPSFSPFPNS